MAKRSIKTIVDTAPPVAPADAEAPLNPSPTIAEQTRLEIEAGRAALARKQLQQAPAPEPEPVTPEVTLDPPPAALSNTQLDLLDEL